MMGVPAQTITFISASLRTTPRWLKLIRHIVSVSANTGYVEGQSCSRQLGTSHAPQGLFERHQIDPEGIYRHEVPEGLAWCGIDEANTRAARAQPDPDWTAGLSSRWLWIAKVPSIYTSKMWVHERLSGAAKRHDARAG